MLDQLRCFLLIAEHGSLTAAAGPAHLSQPALSAALRRLEDELGARLFHRGRRGAEPTAAGRALIPRARAALAAVEDGRRAVAEVAGLRTGEVRIGGGATACTYFLPAPLAAFRRRHPEIRFQVREAYPDDIRAAVDAGEIDLGVVSGPGRDPWLRDELILIASPGAPPPEVATAPFIAFPPGSATRAALERRFPRADIVMELGSIASVKGNVRAGIGVALVSRAAVAGDLAAGRLVELPSPATPIRRRLSLVHRGVDRLPPAAAELRRLLLAWPAAGPARSRASGGRAARSRAAGSRRKPGRPAPRSRL
ncbi:MAG TPA: LysR family transcriptional regulator [Kofleriaceae bacterium]|nr:LysR family transcriptional regulator [Kofleriaceae bacterium]